LTGARSCVTLRPHPKDGGTRMSKNIERWMDRPLPTTGQVVLMTVMLGSVSVRLLLWFGD